MIGGLNGQSLQKQDNRELQFMQEEELSLKRALRGSCWYAMLALFFASAQEDGWPVLSIAAWAFHWLFMVSLQSIAEFAW